MALTQRAVEEELNAKRNEPQERMRVLYIVSLFPCWSETFIVREIEQLLAHDTDIRIFSLKPPQERLVQSNARVLEKYVVYPSGYFRNMYGALRAFLRNPVRTLRLLGRIAADDGMKLSSRLKSIIVWWRVVGVMESLKAWQPDLIHAHWATYPSTAAMILSRMLDIPFSFTSHAHDIFLEKHLLREKLSRARFAVTISEYNQRLLLRLAPSARDKLHVVHCGINADELNYRTDGRESALVLAVGRLDEIKGFPTLVSACAKLKQRGVGFRCEIVGEGPLKDELQAGIDANGLGDLVQLCGAMPYEQVRARLYRAAVFVLPSVVTDEGNMDGIPVALMEAMACGTPVVSTTVSGIPELVEDGVNGFLAPPRDADVLADRIASLLEDPVTRTKFSRNARERVETGFSVATETGKLQRLFVTSLEET